MATALLVLLVMAVAGVSLMIELGLASDACNDSAGDTAGCSLPFVWWTTAAICAGLYLATAFIGRTPRQRAGAARALMFLAGVGLAVFAVVVFLLVLWTVSYATQTPDPSALRTDPEMGPPDTWSDVRAATASSLLLAPAGVAVLGLAAALLSWSAGRRWLPWRGWATGAAFGALVVGLTIAASHAI